MSNLVHQHFIYNIDITNCDISEPNIFTKSVNGIGKLSKFYLYILGTASDKYRVAHTSV